MGRWYFNKALRTWAPAPGWARGKGRHDARSARLVGIALFTFSSLLSVPAFAQIDFSGQWAQRYYEDQEERSPGGETKSHSYLWGAVLQGTRHP